jgi:glycosyltransferase involved in cell wall biosynthesis
MMRYVLITPARNEAAYIGKTLESMVAQTVLPLRWVIVSDGSTDGTDDIVRAHARRADWIRLVHLPDRRERNFAAKVEAFNAGLRQLADLQFDVIGNVDGDISFEPDFFEYLLAQFERDALLGVAGTHYVEGDFHSFRDSHISVEHVNGQCQLFRTACFDDIGGYRPIRGGGIDWVAVTTARMRGWRTRSFAERTFRHHRTMGTADGSELRARFHYGRKDYFLGGHPAWEVCRGLFQMGKRPYVIGGALLLAGYFGSWLTGQKRAVPRELIAFHRKEQLARLRRLIPDLLEGR